MAFDSQSTKPPSSITGTIAGGATLVEANACDDFLRAGPERTYRFQPPTAGEVTVSISSLQRDLVLLVLAEGAAGGCDPTNPGCRSASAATGEDDETVTFSAAAGTPYYLVVDSYTANAGTFTLTVTCP